MKTLLTTTVLATVMLTGAAYAGPTKNNCWYEYGWGFTDTAMKKCVGSSQETYVAPVRVRIPPTHVPTPPIPAREANGADIGGGGGGGGGGR